MTPAGPMRQREERPMILERTRAERQERLDVGLLHVFALKQYTDALREEPEYVRHGRNGVTLVKTNGLRVLLEALRQGAELAEHRAPGPITVQVLEGEIRFQTGEDTFRVRQGETLALPAGRPHSVEAVRDSAFLITIAPVAQKGKVTP
jgi:quercetin dioxygenase-like cupin family protein